MLFNSVAFVFVFFPLVSAGFFLFGRVNAYLAIGWATLASLAFYGWDDPWRLVPLILVSITFNFLVGRRLARTRSGWLLCLGVTGDLLLLGYFKYSGFLLDSIAALSGQPLPHPDVVLPIGISFYTFTQIAFLVDAYRGEAREYQPLKYGLFVTYFPHLIAGPILHHKEIMPQFDRPDTYVPRLDRVALGLTWFAIGLFKKVILADGISVFVDPAYKAASSGAPIGFVDAWIGTVSYALQIYFDFSGYSDMAIGLALMMGITFPLNFNSPYKAHSLIDFWRRWHMTLSRFLRDYLYIPLGGNRQGPWRRHLNLLITMVLGGLWHGASWNFALWGAIHGLGLTVNHLWRHLGERLHITLPAALAWTVTLTVVLFAWVPFRADTLAATLQLWAGMMGLNGLGGSAQAGASLALGWIVTLSAIALYAPNTQELLLQQAAERSKPAARWQPNLSWAIVMGCVYGIAVAAMIQKPTVFLYFRF